MRDAKTWTVIREQETRENRACLLIRRGDACLAAVCSAHAIELYAVETGMLVTKLPNLALGNPGQ